LFRKKNSMGVVFTKNRKQKDQAVLEKWLAESSRDSARKNATPKHAAAFQINFSNSWKMVR